MAIKMYTFKKEERLCSKKLIEELFHNGSSFLLYPFRVTWKISPEPLPAPAQVVINVSKRKFRKAHDRNLLKRRMREGYRLHKGELLYPFLRDDLPLLLSFNFIGKEISNYAFIEKKLIKVFEQIVGNYAKHVLESDN